MEKLKGVIERITYHNEENGFSVIRLEVQGYYDLVTAVGAMAEPHTGAIFNFYGFWKVDPKYGRQFIFQKCEETLPATVNGIKKYLGSGLIKGVGPVYAGRIVKVFGDQTLNILDNDPDRLSEVPGIGAKRIEKIKKSWAEQREIKNIMVFLQSHDVSTSLAAKIFKQYGKESISAVTENPYRLADEIWGIGFKTADTIAKKLGFGHERFERLRSGIFYTLNKLSEVGHCFAYKDELEQSASELLEVLPELIVEPLGKMLEDRDLICEVSSSDNREMIYLPVFYYSEVGTAKRLLRLINTPKSRYAVEDINTWATVDSKAIHYDETQLQAIQAAIEDKVLVLTGGPGTGKTTTTLGIIRAYRESGARILLCAPTGRAAKRMSEVTKMEAKTIHRLLEMKPPEGFQRNEGNPLEGDVLIVDECSMIDVILRLYTKLCFDGTNSLQLLRKIVSIHRKLYRLVILMNSLLKAVPENMTVILVGDVDQLPSVGAGKVLSDILASGAVPSIRLEKIFRQAQRSHIVTNAHKINHGEMPYLTDHASDFLFVEEEDAEKAADVIVNLCAEILPSQGIKADEIQVLTPMRRGATGAVNLNQRLQEILNPNEIGLKRAGTSYRIGDKVMQIRNNYEKSVFNGDIGRISKVNADDNEVIVSFDERAVTYDISELDELVLAYATTIHKSQGSEFPYVVMPMNMSHYVMLQRNLLYTGVTRAKKGLILVGERKAVYIAVKNNKIVERNTRLAERLSGRLGS